MRDCETSFFSASPRHFDFLNCDNENFKCFEWEGDTFRLLKFEHQIELRARVSLYSLLAGFFELTETENSIAQYIMVSYNKTTVAPKRTLRQVL